MGTGRPPAGGRMPAPAAACHASMIPIRAAQEGITLDELTVVVGSVSDDRGMVGVADDVPAGAPRGAGPVRGRAPARRPPGGGEGGAERVRGGFAAATVRHPLPAREPRRDRGRVPAALACDA